MRRRERRAPRSSSSSHSARKGGATATATATSPRERDSCLFGMPRLDDTGRARVPVQPSLGSWGTRQLGGRAAAFWRIEIRDRDSRARERESDSRKVPGAEAEARRKKKRENFTPLSRPPPRAAGAGPGVHSTPQCLVTCTHASTMPPLPRFRGSASPLPPTPLSRSYANPGVASAQAATAQSPAHTALHRCLPRNEQARCGAQR